MLKELEEDVGNAMRDHGILFVHPFLTRMSFIADNRFQFCMIRPIELSKNQKPTRDAFIGTLGLSVGDASQFLSSLFSSTSASASL